ncbi:MAG: aspartate-semialdehyde dehydrogenase [candidate division KSB1 bacterium]|jgi:aspartate-semialdehyde dehydrogenase|nr:aspartate-semialdehyde dehydrogenase [candidate division KSB1 bacterium]
MSKNISLKKKIPVGILGATGSVGQKFVELLQDHPWFEIRALAASERSSDKTYAEAVHWFMKKPIPPDVEQMRVSACEPDLPCRLVFSGLDSSVAGEIEQRFAENGYVVVSNSKNHRMKGDVPLLVPEINSEHLSIIESQKFGDGVIVTNPNCSVIGLVIALKPLIDRFGLDAVNVVTLQALSGAGYPGVSGLDSLDNVIPYIGGEEDKVETEPLKIFGSFDGEKINNMQIKISAQCNRVPVSDGHVECVSVKLKQKARRDEVITAWNNFAGVPQKLELPMAPLQPIRYYDEKDYPQPRLLRDVDKGMAVSIGRLRECPLFDYKFVILSHNTIRGAAGGAILNAELMLHRGYLS